MKWEKIEKTVNAEGTTITYAAEGLGRRLLIQSRKRHIPHANGSGTWDHTTYWVLRDGEELKERHTYRDAQAWAEAYAIERGIVGPEA